MSEKNGDIPIPTETKPASAVIDPTIVSPEQNKAEPSKMLSSEELSAAHRRASQQVADFTPVEGMWSKILSDVKGALRRKGK